MSFGLIICTSAELIIFYTKIFLNFLKFKSVIFEFLKEKKDYVELEHHLRFLEGRYVPEENETQCISDICLTCIVLTRICSTWSQLN
jgi:hypothetical protein